MACSECKYLVAIIKSKARKLSEEELKLILNCEKECDIPELRALAQKLISTENTKNER